MRYALVFFVPSGGRIKHFLTVEKTSKIPRGKQELAYNFNLCEKEKTFCLSNCSAYSTSIFTVSLHFFPLLFHTEKLKKEPRENGG